MFRHEHYDSSHSSHRQIPLILVASREDGVADALAERLRRECQTATVYAAHSFEGCLRVATSVGPDLVVLDASMPLRTDQLLRAHPTSAGAEVLRLPAPGIDAARRALELVPAGFLAAAA